MENLPKSINVKLENNCSQWKKNLKLIDVGPTFIPVFKNGWVKKRKWRIFCGKIFVRKLWAVIFIRPVHKTWIPAIVGQKSPLARISKRYAHDWRVVTRNYVICPSVRKRLKRDSIIISKTNTSVLDQESKGVKQSCLIMNEGNDFF